MTREITNGEVPSIMEAIEMCVNEGSPIKHPLLTTHGVLKQHFMNFQINRNKIAEKYFERDKDGNPVGKEGIENPRLITDYKVTDEDAMHKELEELIFTKLEIEFHTVSPDRTVLSTVNGENKSYKLRDYLEISDKVSVKTVAFLEEFFITKEEKAELA